MRINPQQKLHNKLFYNNICLIIFIFSIICLLTSLSYETSRQAEKIYYNLQEDILFGPVEIKDKAQTYKITAHFDGFNSSSYISGEVLDEDKDTLYEFGKDLWHEEGYDSEGHWSESERDMTAYLTFTEKGTYYIQFKTDENNIRNISLRIQLKKGSYIAHLKVGALFMIFTFLIWVILNYKWVKEILVKINDKMEEMSDD